ncbi:MAG: LysR family transcriptional regulator [Pseudomonadota bacterium]
MSGRRLPNLKDLLAFDATARAGSFTQAAQALNVQQPAVSRRVAELEAWLGLPLFERGGPTLSLTPAGHRLRLAVTEGLDCMEDCIATLQRRRGQRLVGIDASVVFAACWLVPRLAALQAATEPVEVQMTARYVNLPRGGSDTDIVVYFREAGQEIAGQAPVFLEELIPVCAPDYAAKQTITLESLSDQRLLVLDEPPHLQDWGRLLTPLGLPPPPQGQQTPINNFLVYLKAMQTGQGIGLAWRHLVAEQLDSGLLIQPLDISYRSDRGYYAYLTRRAEQDPDARAVFDWLVTQQEA